MKFSVERPSISFNLRPRRLAPLVLLALLAKTGACAGDDELGDTAFEGSGAEVPSTDEMEMDAEDRSEALAFRGVAHRSDTVGTIKPLPDSFGDWSEFVYCDPGTWAYSFRQKIEDQFYEPRSDDTAANGIELYCDSLDNEGHNMAQPSNTGPWGYWYYSSGYRPSGEFAEFSCDVAQRFRGAQVVHVPGQGGGLGANDDFGITAIRFQCDEGPSATLHKTEELINHTDQTTTAMNMCPSNSAVCGVRQQVEKPQGSSRYQDDVALSSVEFACCCTDGHVRNIDTNECVPDSQPVPKQWQCIPGLSTPVRLGTAGTDELHPECHSLDGESCSWYAGLCDGQSGPIDLRNHPGVVHPISCKTQGGPLVPAYAYPDHWCSKSRTHFGIAELGQESEICDNTRGCASGLACANNVCVRAAPEGDACSNQQPCAENLECRDNVCRRPMRELGESCSQATDICADDFTCIGGLCLDFDDVTLPKTFGERCNGPRDYCVESLICVDKECVYESLLGESCDDRFSVCSEGQCIDGTCSYPREYTQNCDGVTKVCVDDSVCSNGTCVRLVPGGIGQTSGEPCDGVSLVCIEGLDCVDGTCRLNI